jgi:hypothetical protein
MYITKLIISLSTNIWIDWTSTKKYATSKMKDDQCNLLDHMNIEDNKIKIGDQTNNKIK